MLNFFCQILTRSKPLKQHRLYKLAQNIFCLGLVMMTGLIVLVYADQITISGTTDTDDSTIYSSDNLGNAGADLTLYAGQTRTGNLHRALIRFNVAGISSTATISAVTVILTITRAPSAGPATVTDTLYRVTGAWVEGTGIGQGTGGGAGGQQVVGAVCWTYSQFSTVAWTNAGGDYIGSPSAIAIAGTSGTVTFTGSGLVSDVQAWVNSSQPNNGWILLGDEATSQSSRGYGSSENTTSPPQLIVTFVPFVAVELSQWKLSITE